MQFDFTDQTGRYDDEGHELYTDKDLRFGADYADWLLSEGYTEEPLYRYDLAAFRDWCLAQLRKALGPMPDEAYDSYHDYE